jgi:hypothetical protein
MTFAQMDKWINPQKPPKSTSNAATARSEAEILVYLQRERAQGMDEL